MASTVQGTTRAPVSDSIVEGNAHSQRVEETSQQAFHPGTRQAKRDKRSEKLMKKLLLITLAVGRLAFIPAQRADAQTTTTIPGSQN